MTKIELIEALRHLPDDHPVYIRPNTEDYILEPVLRVEIHEGNIGNVHGPWHNQAFAVIVFTDSIGETVEGMIREDWIRETFNVST